MNKIAWEVEGLKFLIRNMYGAKKLTRLNLVKRNELTISGLRPNDLFNFISIHKNLRAGIGLNFWRVILYYFWGDRFVVIVKNSDKEIVAFQMLYFCQKEIYENIIHEAFIGVTKPYRNIGLATQIRLYTRDQLKQTELKKISSQIENSNLASLASAKKSGFKIIAKNSKSNAYLLYSDLI